MADGGFGKKRLSVVEWVFLIVGVIALVAGGVTLFSVVNHKIQTGKEKELLAQYDTGGVTEVDGKKVNYKIFNPGKTSRTVVLMPGLNVQDMALSFSPVAEKVDARVVLVNRPGYGGSEDSEELATVENVVEFYRSALKKLGVSGAVYLAPHSISGMYAMYWAEKYSEEVAGILGLDIGAPELYVSGKYTSYSWILDHLYNLGAKLGYHRFFVLNSKALDERVEQLVKSGYDESKARAIVVLGMENAFPDFVVSEDELMATNAQKVLDERAQNYDNVRKLFIVADVLSPKYFDEFLAEETTDEYVEEFREYQSENKDALEGKNADFVTIVGPHNIWEYDAEGVAKVINEFVK